MWCKNQLVTSRKGKSILFHVMTVFGTRPEAIKMAPLVMALKANPEFSVTVCVTAQHRQMLDQVLSLFQIEPDVDLNLMQDNQDLFDVTARVLFGMRSVLEDLQPDMVLVQGDTTTTFGTALGAFYSGIPIGHVEAGLRTWNLRAPFPEEANRCLATRLSALHFCPTEKNRQNLIEEGVDPSKVFVTGNTVIDALLWVRQQVEQIPKSTWEKAWGSASSLLNEEYPIILITGHRRENFGQGLMNICSAISNLASRHSKWHFIYPVHMNPNISKPVHEILCGHDNIHLLRPLDYAPFVYLMTRAAIILTDSGGIQEEAPSLGKPVLVMRENTERPEAVDAGTVELVGTETLSIVDSVEALMYDNYKYNSMAQAMNPYGDGKASSRIVDILLEHRAREQNKVAAK